MVNVRTISQNVKTWRMLYILCRFITIIIKPRYILIHLSIVTWFISIHLFHTSNVFLFWLRYRDCNLLILRNMYPLHTITHTHLVSVETSLIQIKGDHMSRPRQFAATLYCSKMLAIQRVKAEDSSMLEHAASIKVMIPLYRTGGPERYWILQGS